MKTSKLILVFTLILALVVCTVSCGSIIQAGKEEVVKTAVTEYLLASELPIAEVNVTKVKVLTKEEIDAEPTYKSYNLSDTDLVFDITYDVKVKEGGDVNLLAIPNGEVDGEWVRNVSRVGVVRYADGKFTLDPKFFGTGI